VGIAERKEREKEQRRNTIVDAAQEVFFQKGIDDATMDDVAAAAELSKGTLYLYFKSKVELLAAIHVRGMELLASQMRPVLETRGNGLEILRRMAHVFVQYSVKHPEYFNIGYYIDKLQSTDELSSGHWHEACLRVNDEMLSLTISAIEKGILDGSISNRFNPQQLALLLWAGVRGIINVYHIKKKHELSDVIAQVNLPLDQHIQTFFDLLTHGLTGNRSAARPLAHTHKNAS
jgi:AcrR family transcriptional regulator